MSQLLLLEDFGKRDLHCLVLAIFDGFDSFEPGGLASPGVGYGWTLVGHTERRVPCWSGAEC